MSVLPNFLKSTGTKVDLKNITEQNLAHWCLKGSKLNTSLLLPWTFLRWSGVLLHNRGWEGTKKRISLWAELSFFSHSFPFVCALIVEPSLFRRAALFMTQPQTRSLKASTHTHTHYIFSTKTTEALLTPTLSPEWADERRSSLTLAFPHKLKLNERDFGAEQKVAVAFKWKSKSLINHVSRHSAHTPSF